MERKKRSANGARLTPTEKRLAEIDRKIAALEAEREALEKGLQTRRLLREAARTMSLEEIARRLGVELD